MSLSSSSLIVQAKPLLGARFEDSIPTLPTTILCCRSRYFLSTGAQVQPRSIGAQSTRALRCRAPVKPPHSSPHCIQASHTIIKMPVPVGAMPGGGAHGPSTLDKCMLPPVHLVFEVG